MADYGDHREAMTRQEEVQEQNDAIRAGIAGLLALIEELQEAGLVDRNKVSERLQRLRGADGEIAPTVAALAAGIEAGRFSSTPVLRVVPAVND